ncbi:MAG TPA: hypothetical protein VN740_02400 [Solirubrobacteraceae bacterium]|nr:hypothetical protein [Solirubrobacteraceae bacterium]
MGDVIAQRTLVKSVPELWAELSESALLDRMLHEPFGEIRITRLTPESSIVWESELAAGSVELQPSGFGTRVRLTAQFAAEPPPPTPPTPRGQGPIARLLARLRPPAAPAPVQPQPVPALDSATAEVALRTVLDQIGAARHRPFSRQPAH